MTKENKIKNAALYWYTCEKEGFPKGQKEVFQEWLDKDIEHRNTYQKLYRNIIEVAPIEDMKKKKSKLRYLYLILLFCFIFTIIISIQ